MSSSRCGACGRLPTDQVSWAFRCDDCGLKGSGDPPPERFAIDPDYPGGLRPLAKYEASPQPRSRHVFNDSRWLAHIEKNGG